MAKVPAYHRNQRAVCVGRFAAATRTVHLASGDALEVDTARGSQSADGGGQTAFPHW